MKISESFGPTLQGEGRYVGHSCFFIRVSGCNLRCTWCDSKHSSWNPEGKSYTIGEIIAYIKNKGWNKIKHAVISGGEPMMVKDMAELVNELRKNNHFVTIETAGTIFKEEVKPDIFSISPKLKNSFPKEEENPKEFRIHTRNNTYSNLNKFVKSGIEYQLKFVTMNDKDTMEIKDIVESLNVPKENIYLMPEGTTREQLRLRMVDVAEICKREGWIMTPRLHVDIWDDKRGV